MVTKVGEREVFRLTLKDGRSIRTTADHRFLTDSGEWKRLDELRPGGVISRQLRLQDLQRDRPPVARILGAEYKPQPAGAEHLQHPKSAKPTKPVRPLRRG